MSSAVSPPQAAREILRRQDARRNLLAFTTYTKPDYEVSWHHRLICDRLDAVARGECRRLMVFVHPRSGKSELCSRRLPAFFLGQHPDAAVIACSYSSDLASRMNRDVQRVIDTPAYDRLFPGTRLGGRNVRTSAQGAWVRNSDLFEVVGRRGSYRSAGVGAGVTGMGADLIIVDDYLKSAAEARSATIRESQWEWFNSDLYTRQMPGCRIVVICTRWHHDDIPGRLLKLATEDNRAESWEVLRLPAVAEGTATHPRDPRRPGEPLWPSRYGIDWLERARAQLGPHAFEALYQQNPTPREGGLFRYADMQRFLDARPAVVDARVRAWDKGYAVEGDWTVGCLMARLPRSDGGTFVIEDIVRVRCHPHERDRVIKETAEADDRIQPGKRVTQVIEQPPGAGSQTTAELIRTLAGHVARAVRPTGDKSERAEPLAAQFAAGNVSLVRAGWNRALIDEACCFPGGVNDDQVDAMSSAFYALTGRYRLNVFA